VGTELKFYDIVIRNGQGFTSYVIDIWHIVLRLEYHLQYLGKGFFQLDIHFRNFNYDEIY
jgi:hypothetical protein